MDSVNESMYSSSATPSPAASSLHTSLRGTPVSAGRAISNSSESQDVAQSKLYSDISSHMKGEIVYCERKVFEEHYLPFIPSEETVASCIEKLNGESGGDPKILAPILTAGEKWRDFPVLPPEKKEREDPPFERLADIIDTISRQECKGKDGLSRKLSCYRYRSCPNKMLDSSVVFGTENRIDACMTTSRDEPGRMPLTSIAVPLEFKLDCKKKVDVVQNRRQIVSAVNQIMNEDARRMFMYGITIEGPWTATWYFSRSHSAVSQAFDFLEDPKTFVRIFLSLLFATDEELGFDPHVFLDERDGSYVYEFPGKSNVFSYFRTTRLLSGIRSLRISGRAARIWQVRPVNSRTSTSPIGADPVLKDIWLDDNSRTEKEIQESIFADIETFAKSNWRNDPKCQQLGDECINRLTDLFRENTYRGLFLEIGQIYAGRTSKSIAEGVQSLVGLLEWAQSASSAEPVSSPSYSLASPTSYVPKTQSRFLYHEVCTTLHDLPTVGDAMAVLCQAVNALLLIFCAGWVHRDISSGNILAFETMPGTWTVRLADLEYAKRFSPEQGSSDPKTGTPFFMPYEIQSRVPLGDFVEPVQSDTPDDWDATDSSSNKMGIVHNFQHDVESIWWIILWIITARVDHQPSIEYSNRIFQNTLDIVSARQQAFISGLVKQRSDESFLVNVILPSLRGFVQPLDHFRKKLKSSYIRRDDVKDLKTYVDVYPFVLAVFGHWDKIREVWASVPLLRYSRRPVEMQQSEEACRNLPPSGFKRKRQPRQPDTSCEPLESRGSKKSRAANVASGRWGT